MQLSDFVNFKGRTKFRLRLELTAVVFGLLAAQLVLLKVPPLVFHDYEQLYKDGDSVLPGWRRERGDVGLYDIKDRLGRDAGEDEC